MNSISFKPILFVLTVVVLSGCSGLKKMQKNGDLTEDDFKKAEDEVQKVTNKYIEIVDELMEKKEKEMMEV